MEGALLKTVLEVPIENQSNLTKKEISHEKPKLN
jgi:hypothetical protein